MKKIKLILAFFIAILVYSVPVFAGVFDLIPSTVGNISSVIWNITQNEMALMGIVFLFYTMLLVTIFRIGINAIPSFKDSPQARAASIILALMSSLGMVYMSRSNPRMFIERTIVPLGIFGVLLFAGMVFFMVNNLAKNSEFFKDSKWKLYLICLGAALLMAGWMLKDVGPWTRDLISWGMFFLVIGLIATLWGFIKGSGEGKDRTKKTKQEKEDVERGRKPNRVVSFRGLNNGNAILLCWSPNPEEDKVNYYEINKKVRKSKFSRIGRRWKAVLKTSESYSHENPYEDRDINVSNTYIYAIRAVNSYGKGKWTQITIQPNNPLWMPVITGIGVRANDIILQGKVKMGRAR